MRVQDELPAATAALPLAPLLELVVAARRQVGLTGFAMSMRGTTNARSSQLLLPVADALLCYAPRCLLHLSWRMAPKPLWLVDPRPDQQVGLRGRPAQEACKARGSAGVGWDRLGDDRTMGRQLARSDRAIRSGYQHVRVAPPRSAPSSPLRGARGCGSGTSIDRGDRRGGRRSSRAASRPRSRCPPTTWGPSARRPSK
jgi:hypothetical protein